MSFDVFVQGFRDGKAAGAFGAAAVDTLGPFIVESKTTWARVKTFDGGADAHGIDDLDSGLMFNHISGAHVWDLIAETARSAGFVVMALGCPVAIFDGSIRGHLPTQLVESVGVAVVSSGADLLSLIDGD